MYDQSKVMVAGGQGEMAGKVFRFAHMGHISPQDVLAGFAALEQALATLNYRLTVGDGVKAAQAVLQHSAAAAAR